MRCPSLSYAEEESEEESRPRKNLSCAGINFRRPLSPVPLLFIYRWLCSPSPIHGLTTRDITCICTISEMRWTGILHFVYTLIILTMFRLDFRSNNKLCIVRLNPYQYY